MAIAYATDKQGRRRRECRVTVCRESVENDSEFLDRRFWLRIWRLRVNISGAEPPSDA